MKSILPFLTVIAFLTAGAVEIGEMEAPFNSPFDC
jgi:hypothetical protein